MKEVNDGLNFNLKNANESEKKLLESVRELEADNKMLTNKKTYSMENKNYDQLKIKFDT